jgi:heat shock protein 5
MVKEAEEIAKKDNKIWEKIDARNKLKTYIYNMRSAINDKDKLVDKIDSDDKERIKTALKEALEWLDNNQNAEKDNYEEKLKEVEEVCNPVIKQVIKSVGSAALKMVKEGRVQFNTIHGLMEDHAKPDYATCV